MYSILILVLWSICFSFKCINRLSSSNALISVSDNKARSYIVLNKVKSAILSSTEIKLVSVYKVLDEGGDLLDGVKREVFFI